MHSPARKHFQRVSAAQAAGAADPNRPQTGEQYELHAAALWRPVAPSRHQVHRSQDRQEARAAARVRRLRRRRA